MCDSVNGRTQTAICKQKPKTDEYTPTVDDKFEKDFCSKTKFKVKGVMLSSVLCGADDCRRRHSRRLSSSLSTSTSSSPRPIISAGVKVMIFKLRENIYFMACAQVMMIMIMIMLMRITDSGIKHKTKWAVDTVGYGLTLT